MTFYVLAASIINYNEDPWSPSTILFLANKSNIPILKNLFPQL